MKIAYTQKELSELLQELSEAGSSTGFVPTMGALHQGHISLVRRAAAENDVVTCSIFVNPLQFNNPNDLLTYPRQVEKDLDMLKDAGCGLVFLPGNDEMYPEAVEKVYDLGILDLLMEGGHRPGHFNGVAVVVERLFTMMQPDRAYFGEKDYQQIMVIREMLKQTGLPVEIVPCPIIREADGLAMSSRNQRLSPEQRVHAPLIHSVLLRVKEEFGKRDAEELVSWAFRIFDQDKWFDPEYVEIRNEDTLEIIKGQTRVPGARAFVAAAMGDVRLIDNMSLSS
jgi:pantoate--beta-alanine ligase